MTRHLRNWLLSSSTAASSSATTTAATATKFITRPILLLDGGVSTHLEHLLEQQEPNKKFPIRSLWSSSLLLSSDGRDTILQGHKDWFKAGSDILTTVTYQCHYGVASVESVVGPEEMTNLIHMGVQLARQAVDEEMDKINCKEKEGKFVVGSSGCYGAALADGSEYTGNYGSVDQAGLEEFHRRKIQTFLAQTNPLDGLAIETIPCVREVEAVCNVLLTLLPNYGNIACWISLACRDGSTLNEGASIEKALEMIRQKDPHAQFVHAIGINCCDSAHISSLLEIITRDMAQKGPRRGIVVYPNSGEEWDAEHNDWKEGTGCTDANQFSERLKHAVQIVRQTWKAHGDGKTLPPPMIIGGCCRTSPATIRALRAWIDGMEY